MPTLSEHAEALQWGLDTLASHPATSTQSGAENLSRFRAAVGHVRFAAAHEEQQIMDRLPSLDELKATSVPTTIEDAVYTPPPEMEVASSTLSCPACNIGHPAEKCPEIENA